MDAQKLTDSEKFIFGYFDGARNNSASSIRLGRNRYYRAGALMALDDYRRACEFAEKVLGPAPCMRSTSVVMQAGGANRKRCEVDGDAFTLTEDESRQVAEIWEATHRKCNPHVILGGGFKRREDT